MNRALTLLCFLCTVLGARGQSAYNWVYWFDTDSVPKYSGTAGNNSFTIDAMTNELSEGFHTFHVQVADTAGCFSSPQTRLFYRTKDQSAAVLRYWFDSDQAKIHEANFEGGNFTINVNGIEAGLHIINCQVVDASGKMSDVVSRFFIRQIETRDMSWSYWFDDDKDNVQTIQQVDGAVMVDVTELAEGFHTIHQQVHGLASSDIISKWFLKIPQTDQVGDMTVICTVDNKIVAQQNTSPQGGIISMQMDVDSLDFGLHRAAFQVITPTGTASTVAERYFLRVVSDRELNRMHCVYSIDGHQSNSLAGSMGDGIFHFDLDVAELEDGLHRLSYMMVSEEGVTTSQKTAFFWKTPLGGPGIVQYDYWLNDDEEHLHKVKLDKREDPFKLITLLPVETQPIRSSCFHFEVKDAKPMIYAKNDFHIRFFDTSAKVLNETKQFVDYSVKQEVEPVGELQATQTFERPAEGDIRWYKLNAEFGDSLSFKTNMACSIQLFSPTGKEVYSVSGSKSIVFGGIHAYEDGTYYMALHDVTGTKSSTITIDYQKIDRYAILAFSPNVIGVPSEAVVNLIGNGFDRSAKVSLFKDGTDYWSNNIHTEKISELSALFDFNDIPFGKYGLKVLYTPEDSVCIPNAITIEEADTISDISIKLEGNPYFIAGGTANYSIRITNNSNLTVFSLPITLSIECEGNVNNVPYLKFDNDYTASSRQSLHNTFADILTASELEELEHYVFGDNDLSMFYIDTLSHPGKAYLVGNFVIPQLEGNSSITMPFTLKKVNHNLTLYAATQPHWSKGDYINLEAQYANGTRKRAPRRSAQSSGCLDPCSMGVVATCIVTITESAMPVGFSELLGDCIKGYVKDKFGGIFSDIICNGEEPDFSKLPKTPAPVLEDIVVSLWDCASENMIKQGVVKVFGKAVAGKILKVYSVAKDCVYEPFKTFAGGCPGDGNGGSALPIHSYDPNEIYGYVAESGSKTVKDEQTDLHYTIQFENDTTFATASAHDIYLTDTLDAQNFDFSTFAPTRIKIGEKSSELTGNKNFVTTVDMRPEINAIAQVEGSFDQTKGIARWHITSLDPMTMEPTDDPMDGVLPVNTNGNGIGEVSYNISLKQGLVHGTTIANRAGIVFDNNSTIMTPIWTNVLDRISPESHVADVQMATDETVAVRIEATDELSGPWRYNVYVQYGSGAWFLGAENVPIDSVARVKVYEGIDHGFYTLVTDSAGNVEQKEAAREFSFEVFAPQVDTNTKIELAQGWNWISHNQQEVLAAEALKPKAQRIVSQTDELFKDSRFGWTGDLEELLPTELYKVQMAEADEVQLSGKLFNAAFRSIPLYEGWNWVGYPVANTMSPAEALQRMEAEEGDFIVGQDGLATFTEGQWTGTLMEMQPGLGYMYRSVSDKNLFYNATAQSSSRRANVQRSMVTVQCPDGWTVDKRKYPNVMGLVADLLQDGEIQDANEWLVAAFCGEECRGLSQVVNGHLMMNIYGQGGERITFMAQNRESGEVMGVEENETFRTDILGTMQHPYELHSGVLTGIAEIEDGRLKTNNSVYDLQGRRVEKSSVANGGVYIVTDGGKTKKHVNYKRNK